MPDYYPTIGDAIGAALDHNARMAAAHAVARDAETATDTDTEEPTPPPCNHRPNYCWGCPGGCASCRCHDDREQES